MPRTAKLIGAVERALDILELFSERTPELGTTEIAEATGLHKSTAAGLIYTLAAKGYLAQNSASRKYRLGLKALGLARVVLSSMDLRQAALPYLHQLRDQFDETVNLAILDDGYMVYIERILCARALGMRSEVGKRERAHSTALGKAILAHSDPAEVHDYVTRYGLPASTARTVTDRDTLQQHLEAALRQGYAVDDEENQVGGRCLAAPIFDYTGRPVAALSISAPAARLSLEVAPQIAATLCEAARAISASLGYSTN